MRETAGYILRCVLVVDNCVYCVQLIGQRSEVALLQCANICQTCSLESVFYLPLLPLHCVVYKL